jgi:hypothetical protein
MMIIIAPFSFSQMEWKRVDSLFDQLPQSVHVYKTSSPIDGKPNIAYYVEADLADKHLTFTVDTTYNRRLKPSQFYEKNKKPFIVVNATFFSFATNQNLNLVIKDSKLLGYNVHSIAGRGRDTLTYRHPFGSALGISKKGKADIAWLLTDSSYQYAYASQLPIPVLKDSIAYHSPDYYKRLNSFERWKMKTAIGGGPVLLQNSNITIANEQELKFTGKAINDKHPRTAMGYTRDNKLIILVIEGRNPGNAEGATLGEVARIFKDLNCVEALNLDGGGSSCMLVNGSETIKPSDKEGQRPVPAVFIINGR